MLKITFLISVLLLTGCVSLSSSPRHTLDCYASRVVMMDLTQPVVMRTGMLPDGQLCHIDSI